MQVLPILILQYTKLIEIHYPLFCSKHRGKNIIVVDRGYYNGKNHISWTVIGWSYDVSPLFGVAGSWQGPNAKEAELEALLQAILLLNQHKLPDPTIISLIVKA